MLVAPRRRKSAPLRRIKRRRRPPSAPPAQPRRVWTPACASAGRRRRRPRGGSTPAAAPSVPPAPTARRQEGLSCAPAQRRHLPRSTSPGCLVIFLRAESAAAATGDARLLPGVALASGPLHPWRWRCWAHCRRRRDVPRREGHLSARPATASPSPSLCARTSPTARPSCPTCWVTKTEKAGGPRIRQFYPLVEVQCSPELQFFSAPCAHPVYGARQGHPSVPLSLYVPARAGEALMN